MQRPELVTTRRPTAAAAAELGQRSSGARKKMKEREVAEGPSGRPIYKGELISGRENRGDHGMIISPRNASIFGMTVKVKIRCGSGGVKKTDLMEDDVTADYPESRG